jgi:hypothetical protein
LGSRERTAFAGQTNWTVYQGKPEEMFTELQSGRKSGGSKTVAKYGDLNDEEINLLIKSAQVRNMLKLFQQFKESSVVEGDGKPNEVAVAYTVSSLENVEDKDFFRTSRLVDIRGN